MPGVLDGKVAVVTGAGSGIGRATALDMAGNGAKVVVADVVEEGGRATVDAIERAGGESIFVRTDVTNGADVAALMQTAVSTYGRLDCAVNNAGIGGTSRDGRRYATHECPDDQWARIISVNLTGVFLCLKYEIAQMLALGGGAIVNTASIAGMVGGFGTPYVASKHGVIGVTRNTALEYARQGIRINAVCPGPIDTPMVEAAFAAVPDLKERWLATEPVGRIAAPSEVAAAITWLCSDAASFVTGVALPVDGGWTAQ
jgi:NAD(P)-dependent dehydrogenase (short-subunit alcohol dehydrogenase family)